VKRPGYCWKDNFHASKGIDQWDALWDAVCSGTSAIAKSARHYD